jgi:hypothetical protein
MIGQILPNNNERCYSNFSPTFEHTPTSSLGKPTELAELLTCCGRVGAVVRNKKAGSIAEVAPTGPALPGVCCT